MIRKLQMVMKCWGLPLLPVLSIEEISLLHFKNYPVARFRFEKRITGICGKNGVGKTNLLDAIYYLCFTKSYFTRADAQLVCKGHQGFRVDGNFRKYSEANKLIAVYRETGKKEFLHNNIPYEKFSSHIGQFPCVIIAPDDVQIITQASDERRRFVDALLSQIDAAYLQSLIDYNRILQQRNSYLKSPDNRRSDHSLLDIYDQQLMAPAQKIYDVRKSFLSDLIISIKDLYKRIAGTDEELGITYKSQLHQSSFAELLKSHRERDLLLQRTNAGIHRDDIDMYLGADNFKSVASQGQRKSLLFALKLAEFDALKKIKGFSPILLLDDVFEKLDSERMHNLLDKVCMEHDVQIIITDTHQTRIAEHLETLGADYQIIAL